MNPTSTVKQPDNELLSDEELHAALTDLLIDYDKYTKYNEPIPWNVRKKEFVELIQSQKQAHANMVIGEDNKHTLSCTEYKKMFTKRKADNICICDANIRNSTRAEQRQRNSNHV